MNCKHVSLVALFITLVSNDTRALVAKRVWQNFSSYPQIQNSVDYFPVMRVMDGSGQFYSGDLAIEDVHLAQPTRVTAIAYFSVHSGAVQVQRGDWYVLDGHQYTFAYQVILSGLDESVQSFPVGVDHQSGSMIYVNILRPQNLQLPAGDFYIGVRPVFTQQEQVLGSSQILAYPGSKGWSRAGLIPSVDLQGSINGPIFYFDPNYTAFPYELEWAIVLFGEV